MPGTLQSLLQKISSSAPVQIEGDPDYREPTFLTDDSRKANEDCIFSATSLGEKYITSARERGARVFLIPASMKLTREFSDCVLIRAENLKSVQGLLASELNGNPSQSLHLVGVTGTNGKTSTAHMLYHIWKNEGIRPGMIGTLGIKYCDSDDEEISYSTGYTTPRAGELQGILKSMKDSGVTHVVLEASSEALFLGRLEGCLFSASVFINLTPEHLNFHGDMEEYFRAKMRLFDLTKGRMIVNVSGDYGDRALEYARGIDPDRTVALYKPFVENIPSPVYFNRINASLAVLAHSSDEMRQKFAVEALRILPSIPGRFNILPFDSKSVGIVDYAHTPDALENVLKETRGLDYDKICIVFGCGGDRDTSKRPLMGKIATQYADFIIVTDDNPRTENPDEIRSQIVRGMKDPKEFREISDRRLAIRHAAEWLSRQSSPSAVIVAGKGHENYQIFFDKREEFSDTEVLREEFLQINEKLAVR